MPHCSRMRHLLFELNRATANTKQHGREASGDGRSSSRAAQWSSTRAVAALRHRARLNCKILPQTSKLAILWGPTGKNKNVYVGFNL